MSGRSAAAIKVPVWRALAEAFRHVFGDFKSVGRIGWLPFLVLFGLGTAMRLFPLNGTTGAIDPQIALPAILLGFVALVVQTLCYNALMVGWYRHVLGRAGISGTVG